MARIYTKLLRLEGGVLDLEEHIVALQSVFGQIAELDRTATVRFFTEQGSETVELRLDDQAAPLPAFLRHEGQGICFIECVTNTGRRFGRFEYGGGPIMHSGAQLRLIESLGGA